ncbi:MAG: HD family phosphohydrolase [Desulfuromonadales bacterium GWD2_61_12]|nr:MAG: HD family phosphohydrolase [Desulfuromonadales bacterium GWC2_61_20]OGR34110.1 MAG: HD family phosphohydrolase [Desulfuromonadales bacterium GWD2_61_12]HAD04784.1 HD family phosphohydrolase [Desulfuromonas sp.]HBT82304.1 HD family phosphohydrolase [Desulfuromonas sp.]
MKKIFVEQIRERDWVDSPFLVRDKIMAMAKNGKPYMTLKLIDRSGEVEARVWDRVDEYAERFERDDFIRVQAKASVYLGKMQLVVQELERLADSDVLLADYMPVSARNGVEMAAEFEALVASLTDENLRALMQAFLADISIMERYRTAPAAKSMHHVFIGGLLEHSLAVAGLVDDISRRYPGVNRDLLLVGALLHDIGKVGELAYARTFDYTDEGKLIGHIVLGVEMVEEKIRTIPNFPRQLAMLVKHLLLSHHGQYEYGSPKRPKILEAVILNFLDDLDSKINGVQAHIERESVNDNPWTSYHRLYDRYFFKDTTSAEAKPPAAKPTPAVVAAPMAATPPTRSEPPRDKAGRQFGFTLGEQLKGKSLDLFSAEESEKE